MPSEQVLIFSAMILSAMAVYILEKQFGKAALWALSGAVLAWFGLLHSYTWTIGDTVLKLGWGAGSPWAISYCLLALLLLYAQWQKTPD